MMMMILPPIVTKSLSCLFSGSRRPEHSLEPTKDTIPREPSVNSTSTDPARKGYTQRTYQTCHNRGTGHPRYTHENYHKRNTLGSKPIHGIYRARDSDTHYQIIDDDVLLVLD